MMEEYTLQQDVFTHVCVSGNARKHHNTHTHTTDIVPHSFSKLPTTSSPSSLLFNNFLPPLLNIGPLCELMGNQSCDSDTLLLFAFGQRSGVRVKILHGWDDTERMGWFEGTVHNQTLTKRDKEWDKEWVPTTNYDRFFLWSKTWCTVIVTRGNSLLVPFCERLVVNCSLELTHPLCIVPSMQNFHTDPICRVLEYRVGSDFVSLWLTQPTVTLRKDTHHLPQFNKSWKNKPTPEEECPLQCEFEKRNWLFPVARPTHQNSDSVVCNLIGALQNEWRFFLEYTWKKEKRKVELSLSHLQGTNLIHRTRDWYYSHIRDDVNPFTSSLSDI